MELALYNYLSRKKEPLRPIRKDWVGLYTCGPTVYNLVHIGNLRTYIFEDILRRALEYSGVKVKHVMNITDVEDKIIRDAGKAGKTIFEFVQPYETMFFEDLKKLNILPAWKYPKATEHIPEMIRLIEILLHKKLAYAMDGSVYFAISKFKRYGKLSRLKSRDIKTGARVDADEYEKNAAEDFVLWKAEKPDEPAWDAPFGRGRPGWHIECSAMSMKYLGTPFDIHAGGVDLVFPHHENEIAQSEAATGKPFVHFFVEGEHLLADGQKMAKSLGNFYTLRDLEEKGVNPLAFRYLMLTAHYRAKLNFTWESLKAAEETFVRLQDFIRELLSAKKPAKAKSLEGFKKEFEKAIMNDLDTPKALAVIWKIFHAYHKNPDWYDPKEILKLLYQFDMVLGLNLKELKQEEIPVSVTELLKKREALRKEKKWQEADAVRDEILEKGWEIKDTPEGSKMKRRSV